MSQNVAEDRSDSDSTAVIAGLGEVRESLEQKSGEHYWRSIDEWSGSESFQDFLKKTFPSQAESWLEEGPSRRNFLRLMGASLGLAGLQSCTRQPVEKIYPASRDPEYAILGKPKYYATAAAGCAGEVLPLLVESHEGRPTKIEGNDSHPDSLGATGAEAQAQVLSLYDPDRSKVVKRAGRIDNWEGLLKDLGPALEKQRDKEGLGFCVLSRTITSPTLAAQREALLQEFPKARWFEYEPLARDAQAKGLALAYGRDLLPTFHFAQADVVVSIGSDFLATGPGHVRHAREFAARRRVDTQRPNRMYAIESTPTVTGTNADHRLPLSTDGVRAFTFALAKAMGVEGVPDLPADRLGEVDLWEPWIAPVVEDLRAHEGAGIVLAGDGEPAIVHALCFAISDACKSSNRTYSFAENEGAFSTGWYDQNLRPLQFDKIRELATSMKSEESVELLVILDGNPVFDAPADVEFGPRLKNLEKALTIYLGPYENETSDLTRWHVPKLHFLESWGDEQTVGGVVSLVQPLIAPLYFGKTEQEMTAALLGNFAADGHSLVRENWEPKARGKDFEKWWARCLHDGVVEGTRPTAVSPFIRGDLEPILNREVTRIGRVVPGEGGESVEILFRPDYGILDGRYANNGWLQECPRPVTMLTWDNAALVSPALAQRLGLDNGQLVRLQVEEEASVEIPVWITPGQAENCVTVNLGYGRRTVGSVGRGVGTNVYPLRSTNGMWTASRGTLTKLSGRAPLATTQEHHSMEGRDIVRVEAQDRFLEPEFAAKDDGHHHDYGGHGGYHETSLYPERLNEAKHKWGMVIDLSSCTGCNACVVSCQSENNIPVVGMEEVARGREMQWIRIDRYYQGDPGNPRVVQQPLTCMHCENAPCEVVCPVAATVHSPEGLNQMVYNRCVGTRYCSNNCPYKVRRFNFFKYSDTETESLKLGRNPDVTVRTRGVMEKCSYCVQRISAARIEGKKSAGEDGDYEIADGKVKSACQQVCPSEAITFGDLNDENSRVSQLAKSDHMYGLLTELNTVPRTNYLPKTLNPNPVLLAVLGEEMPKSAHEEAHGSSHGSGSHEESGHGGAGHGDAGHGDAGHGEEGDSHEG